MTYNLEVVVRQLPAYAELRDQLDRLDTITLPNPTTQEPAAWLRDALNAGGTVKPAELLKAAAGAVTDGQVDLAARNAIGTVRRALEDQLLALRTSAAVFEQMNTDLEGIIGQARDLAPYEDLASAETAIAAARGEDWQRLSALGVTYTELRGIQLELMSRITGQRPPSHPLACMVADPLAVIPTYHAWHARAQVVPPWPVAPVTDSSGLYSTTSTGRDTVAEDWSAPHMLTWALENSVELVVPTPDEYETAVDQLTAASPVPAIGVRYDAGRGHSVHESGYVDLSADSAPLRRFEIDPDPKPPPNIFAGPSVRRVR